MSLKLRLLSAYNYEQREAKLAEKPRAETFPLAARIGLPLAVVIAVVWAAAFVIGFNGSLWILTGIGFLLVVLGLRFPVAGLFGIGILAAIDPVTRVYLPQVSFYRWNTLNYWLIVVLLLNIPMVLHWNNLQTRLLQVFILLVALQLSYSVSLIRGVEQLMDVTSTLALLIYVLRVVRERSIFLWLAIVLGVLAGVGGLVFNLQFNDLPYLNPNTWASFPLAALFAVCLAYVDAKATLWKLVVMLTIFAVNYGWIFLSGSRGNMASGLVCFLFILWHSRKMAWTPLVMALAVALGYWITTTMVDKTTYAISRVTLLFDTSSSLARRTSERSLLVEGGLKIFQAYPMGIGTGSFRDNFAEVDIFGRTKPSHSAWITILTEGGIPGISIFVLFLLSFVLMGLVHRKEGLLPFGILVAGIVAVVFISKEFYFKAMWLTVAAGIVVLNQEEMLKSLPIHDPLRVVKRYQHLWLRPFGPSPLETPSLAETPVVDAAVAAVDGPIAADNEPENDAPSLGGLTPSADGAISQD